MNRSIILLAAAALFLSGCEKLAAERAAAREKHAEAEAVAAKAQARLAARLTAKSSGERSDAAGVALVGMLCSSPKLMDDIEGRMDLIEALSGEGGDRDEQKRQAAEFRKRYRATLEKGLISRGSTYQDFSRYAGGQGSAEQKQKFIVLVAEQCPRGDRALVEKTAGGLIYYFTDRAPK